MLVGALIGASELFQSTLPLRGATPQKPDAIHRQSIFQSTLPLRGATSTATLSVRLDRYFNPHSPCGERPVQSNPSTSFPFYFNPHSPCGERQPLMDVGTHDGVFQSTLPLRGATKSYGNVQFHLLISIHTPLAGSDSNASIKSSFGNISIHTPLAGSDIFHTLLKLRARHFNLHSPCGERLRPQKAYDRLP